MIQYTKRLVIEDSYYYKGSSNYNITIETCSDGIIRCYSSYEELMYECTSVKQLGEFLVKLANDEFA